MGTFIGRDVELGVLRECFIRSAAGSGNLVLISGEAGIGKTSLAQTFLDDVTSHTALILRGYCYDLSTTPPYGLWLEMTDRYRPDGELPELPEVLKRGLRVGELPSQLALFEVARDFFVSVSSQRPLVLVLEDLHWADRASLDLLRYLARQVNDQRVLIIASYRGDEITRHHPLYTLLPLLVRETQATRIELDPLTRGEVRALARTRWRLPQGDELRLVEHLMVHAEGHPLFAVEVMRTLEQYSFLAQSEDGWRLADLSHVPVPTLVQQVIEGRLAQLGEEARRYLEVAAVIGHRVPFDVWQSVTGISEEELLRVLDQAVSLHLLEVSTRADSVQFVHALTREALYDGILPPRRRIWHRLIADILTNSLNPEPDVVAHHFQQANDPRAADWLTRAGDQARYTWAALTAVERYKAALAVLIENNAPIVEQGWLLLKIGIWSRDFGSRAAITYLEEALAIGAESGDQALRAMTLWHVGQNRFFVAENGIREMQQGSAALRALSASDREVVALRFPGYDLNEVWNTNASLALMHSIFGRFEEAIPIAEEYLAEVDHRNASRYLQNDRGHAELALVTSFAALGLPEKAERAFQRMNRNYRAAGNDWLRAISAVFHYQYCVSVYYLDIAERRGQSVFEVVQLWEKVSGVTTRLPSGFGMLPVMLNEGDWGNAREISLPFANREMVLHFIAVFTLGLIARHQGDRDLAWKQVRTGFPDGPETEPGSTWHKFLPDLQRLAVELAIDEGEHTVARRWLQAHDYWLEWSRRIYGRPEGLLLWARLLLAEGNFDASHEYSGEALKCASDPRQPKALISIHRFLGELATLTDARDDAEQHLRQSLELADACAISIERALTLLAMAELEGNRNNQDVARSLLEEASTICTALGARPTLERVDRLLARLTFRHAEPPLRLTARELDVLRLVVDGRSDKEIAGALSISHHTVMRHVSHILAKLDVESRTAAASYAVRNDLL